MSLRPNRYRLAIGARIELSLPGAAPRPVCAVPLPPAAAARRAALDAALEGLARSGLPRLDSVEAVLGYPHARHLVLPWQDAILAPAERCIYGRAMLAGEYGFAPGWEAEWNCTLTQQAFGRACIAAAVSRGVQADIAASARKYGLRLRPPHTFLAETIAAHRGPLPDDAAFMAAGRQACEFAFRRNGEWQHAFALPRGARTNADCLRSAALLARHFPARIFTGFDGFDGVGFEDACEAADAV